MEQRAYFRSVHRQEAIDVCNLLLISYTTTVHKLSTPQTKRELCSKFISSMVQYMEIALHQL